MKWNLARLLGGPAIIAVLALFITGCSSTPKIDWNSRVGNYTYNQAVMELGPPVNSTKLDDGTVVAEWFLRHRRSGGLSVGVGMGGYSGGAVGVSRSIADTPTSDYLRLTFGPDGMLSQWGTVTK